jgi:ATP-dependent Clp protease ATP-binding subunit ClpX
MWRNYSRTLNNRRALRKLVSGSTVFICDERVELCMDIIREENKSSLARRHPDAEGNLQGPRRLLTRPN